jgi:hypothetical protein
MSPMTEIRDELKDAFAKLEQERQELRLKMHLGGMEAKEKFEELEGRWEKLRGRMKLAGEEAGEVGEDVKSALDLLFDEIKDGYRSIRTKL